MGRKKHSAKSVSNENIHSTGIGTTKDYTCCSWLDLLHTMNRTL